MKRRQSAICGVILSWCCMASAFAETVNRIVAVVNDDIITQADVAAFIAALQNEPGNDPAPAANDPQMQRAVLQRLIDQHLILQEATHSGVTVETDDVLQRYEAFRNRFPSDELFHQSGGRGFPRMTGGCPRIPRGHLRLDR